MNTENRQLLSSLVSNVPDSGPVVKCPCPLHSDGAQTLAVHENLETGVSHFECTHPACRFYGDAISLVAAAKHCSIGEAVNMFRPGGALASTLRKPLLEAEAAAYTESHMAQSRIQAYMVQCQQALRQTPQSIRLRAGLTRNNLRLLPQELGTLVRGDDIPVPFRQFNKAKYRTGCYLVYPYTYNGEVTHARVQEGDQQTACTTNVTLTRQDLGVYMERFEGPIPQRLVVTYDPRSASILYGNCMAETSQKPPIVAIAGFPLPETYREVTHLYLFVPPDCPLSLTDAVHAFAAPAYVEDAPKQPKLCLWRSTIQAEQMTAERLRTGTSPTNKSHPDIACWIADEMLRLIRQGNVESVMQALNSVVLPEERRVRLLGVAANLPDSQKLVDLIQTSTSSMAASKLLLGNGHLLQIRQTGLRAISRKGDEEPLSNVGIQIAHKIRTHTGEEVLMCQITTEDTQIAPLQVGIPESAWARSKAIQKVITKAYTERGETPYVALYDQPGYCWADILAKLSERCELHHEVVHLGADEQGNLHFPQAIINTVNNEIILQKRIFTLPEPVLGVYNGVVPGTPSGSCGIYRRLLEQCDNQYCCAFTAGIMHVIFHATNHGYNLGKDTKGVKGAFHPQHLMFVESEPGIWMPTFRQLAALFSNSNFITTLMSSDPLETINAHRTLGTLPLISRIPGIRPEKYRRLIQDSPCSLISLVSGGVAMAGGGDGYTSYLVPQDGPQGPTLLGGEDLEELRQSFAGFLTEYLARIGSLSADYHNAAIPASAAYRESCRILGVAPKPMMDQVLRGFYGGYGLVGVDALFDILHVAHGTSEKRPIGIVQGRPPMAGASDRGQHVFLMDDLCVITHAAIGPLNTRYDSVFGISELTRDFKAKSLLVEPPTDLYINTNRCWVISRKTWDERVVRSPIWFREPVQQGGTIQLNRIA